MAEEPWFKCGSLSRVIKGQFSKKIKELYGVLYKGYRSNMARLELYENEKSVSSGIYLFMLVCSDLVKITKISGSSREDKHSFVLATKDQQYVFCLKNVHECDQWVEAIKEIMQSLQSSPTVAAKGPVTAVAAAAGAASQKNSTVTVNNDIYDAFTDVCCEYTVTVGKDTRQKLPVDGPVRLVVEDRHITIIGPGGNRLIRWNIKNLRRIGYSDYEFHVEAGRRCESGVGYYSFDTNMGRQIYIKVEEEKLLYSNPASKDAKESLPVGMVPSVVRSDSPPLAIGGHIYEDINDLFKPDTNHKPEMPVQVPPGMTKGTTASLPGAKQPLENGSLVPSNDTVRPQSLIPAFANSPQHNTDINVYSEVKEYKDAWKDHGIGDEGISSEKEPQYENIVHYRPTDTEVKESYDNIQKAKELKKRDTSPIYAKVNKSKFIHKKK